MTIASEWTPSKRDYPHDLKWKWGSALGEQSATWQEFTFMISRTRAHIRGAHINSLGLEEMRDCPILMEGFVGGRQFAKDYFLSLIHI